LPALPGNPDKVLQKSGEVLGSRPRRCETFCLNRVGPFWSKPVRQKILFRSLLDILCSAALPLQVPWAAVALTSSAAGARRSFLAKPSRLGKGTRALADLTLLSSRGLGGEGRWEVLCVRSFLAKPCAAELGERRGLEGVGLSLLSPTGLSQESGLSATCFRSFLANLRAPGAGRRTQNA